MTTQPVNNKTAVGKSPPSWNQIRVLFSSIASVYPSAGRTATARGIHYSYTFLKPLSNNPKPSRAYSAPPRLSTDPADVIRSLPSPDTPLPFTESPVEPVIASLDTFPEQIVAKHCDKPQDHSLFVVAVDEPAIHPAAEDPDTVIQSPVVEEPAAPTSDKRVLDPVEEDPVSQPTVTNSLSDVPPILEASDPAILPKESILSPYGEEAKTTRTAESSLFEDTSPSTLAAEEAFVTELEQISESESLVAQEPESVTEVEQIPETSVVNEVSPDEVVSTVLDDLKDPFKEPEFDQPEIEPSESVTRKVLDEPTQEVPIPPAEISTSVHDVSKTDSSEFVDALGEPTQKPPATASEKVPEPSRPITEEAPTTSSHPIRPSPIASSSRLPVLRSNSTPMTPDKRRTSKIPAARPTMSFSLKTASKVDLKAKPNESKLKTQPLSTPLPGRAIPRPASPRPSSPRPSHRSPIKSAPSDVLSSPRTRPTSRMREADVPMAKKTGKKKEDEEEEDKPPARLTVQEKRRREAMRAQQIKLWRVREEREARDARTVARRKMMEEGANEIRRRRQLANGTTPTITTTTNSPSPPRRAVKFNLKRNKVIEITQESIE